ncbi:Rad4 transglutaminase-like domain-containing protein [Biscogniauxia marginata]|nr:Rad4 transglutaminase-like domain-containing protein [Biscogniauxia marginata]
MPPHVPRKRLRTQSPDDNGSRPAKQSAKGKGKGKGTTTPVTAVPPRKTTLFDDLDSPSVQGSAEKTKSVIQRMHDDDDDDDSSSLSSLSDAEFEDVPAAKRQKVDSNSEGSDEDEDMEFEDVPSYEHQREQDPIVTGDIELTLYRENGPALASELGKKGPSKREKAIRLSTHCIHVQFLMWHNAIRNSWLCDEEVQAIMISHLPPRLWDEVDRWRRNSGLDVPEEPPKKELRGGKKNVKGKGKQKASKSTRDWGEAADRLEKGIPDMSHGDPLFRLVKCLLSWWKQRFRVTAPGLRKWGYMGVRRLGKLRAAFEEEDHDPERFGERIRDIEEFRRLAQDCVGSRDVGSQLFTALLRGLGLEARMVANIQSLGFGWSKIEEADDESQSSGQQSGTNTSESTSKKATGNAQPAKARAKRLPIRPASRRKRKSDKDALRMDLDDSDEFAEPLTDESNADSDVEDVTDAFRPKRPEAKPYDKDLEYPHYWTEILSPVTKKYLPVDPIVKSIIGTSRELVESLEPRGGKAEKAKQIMAYCIGFSQDGTAKDVTVRYLKKQIFPGKTKGVRMSEEKVPVYNKYGKVKRYDQFDWFKLVMRGYSRGDKRHPIDEVDEVEESTDLKPAKPEKKEVKEGEETLQYYKTSKEYVLERHLKREEALLPGAAPVKVFRNKGKGSKVEQEDVYLRKDVVAVKSAETWHKQGRAPMDGVEPLKHAPYRAATTNRRREIAEAEAATGKKVMQPLYSFEQTDWIIPDPIQNGVIPKNEYGNIDMFAEHMCPEGAVHVPYRGCVRVCKRLEIDYAEAVVGFEFGHRMAVPVIQGVVIAEENYERMIEELEKDEAERARKEDEKRRKEVLGMWRKLLMGLRIADRLRQDYGSLDESVEVFGHERDDDNSKDLEEMREKDEEMAGGFLPEGYEEEEEEAGVEPRHTSDFFPTAHEDEEENADDPFEVEYGNKDAAEAEEAPLADPMAEPEVSAPAKRTPKKAVPKPKAKPKQSTRRRSRRKKVVSSDEDEDEDDFEVPGSDD